ncbi:unnamed protein product [Phaedon cochleariae]|uniref:Uncharacterized protein n=1 Tax=Phaedon cochleariae TaxID=80249 RepID=A0A9P0GUM9_PHACE|nr:unnamed protein product [Phaedon cochleariae]
MCVSAVPTSFLVCFSLGVYFLVISITCGTKMAIEGLPIRKQEPFADQDILAGADFLSVFMDASLRRAYSETSTSTQPTTILLLEETEPPTTTRKPTTRRVRSTLSFAQTTEQFSDTSSDTDRSDSDGIILAVRVSSSVHKGQYHSLTVDSTTSSSTATTEPEDQNIVASEEHPSIVARASKSELSVEENEPITKDSDLVPEFTRSYPATVRELPTQSGSSYDPGLGFLDKASKQPYHQTVIYHDDPSEPSRARSVSYSSILQAVPGVPVDTEKPIVHERHERNYNGAKAPYTNTYHSDNSAKTNETRSAWSPAKAAAIQPTSRPHLPKVYGMPEQNYEVDEAVSVVTNGRAHGIQSVKKAEDNQKVGYVVEGRNYRKYRVEERTADGFIVGEYGVVSHDDGSLRGVRYTADGTINPRLISEALLKFLSL